MAIHITLVFECETDSDIKTVRELAIEKQCRAWSMDHEMVRLDLIRQAIEDNDMHSAARYIEADGIMKHLPELRTA